MKKAILSILAAVCVGGVAAPVLAQVTPVTVPWYSSFEGYPGDGSLAITTLIDGVSGAWVGDADVVAVVTNFDYSALIQPPKVTNPLNDTTSGNVVTFKDGGITNIINNTTLPTPPQVWVDVMLQPIRMEQPTMTAAISNSQMSLFVDTNGFINVYHSVLTNADYTDWTPAYQQWTVLNDGVFPPIGTDKWVRLTVSMDYSQYGTYNLSLFQVTVNGHTFTNDLAYTDIGRTSSGRPGSWFVCANNAANFISQVAFSGSGMFDDLVITNGAVTINAGLPLITASASTYKSMIAGSISPAGPVQLTASPGTTNFSITANPFFHIASITTGTVSTAGDQVAGAQGTNSFSVDMTVAQDSFINVTFAPDLANNRTPMYWLASFTNAYPSFSVTDDAVDFDHDGAMEWQEYVAGTDPTDPNSVLKLVSQSVVGTTNMVAWQSTTTVNDTNATYYVLQVSGDLGGSWSNRPKAGRTSGVQTQAVKMTTSPAFYRVSFTN